MNQIRIHNYLKKFLCVLAFVFLFHSTISLSVHIRQARCGVSSRMHLAKWVSCKIAFTFSCLLLLSTKRRGLIAAVHWLRRRKKEEEEKAKAKVAPDSVIRIADDWQNWSIVRWAGRQAGGTTLGWGGQLRVAESRSASVDKSLWKWLLPPKELVASLSRHIWLPLMMMRRVAIGTEIDW